MSMKFIGFLKKQMAHIAFYVCVVLVFAQSPAVFADYTVDSDGRTVRGVETYEDLTNALARADIETIIVSPKCITLPDGAVLDGQTTNAKNKTIQVEKPFLPEDGSVRIAGTGDQTYILKPAEGEYSTYNLFKIEKGSKVTIKHVTLMGGFTGERTVGDDPSVGGIDNYGYLEMIGVDMLRTGTALLNRPLARALLEDCNIVRNANWYGGGILNFSEAYKNSSGETDYRNGERSLWKAAH